MMLYFVPPFLPSNVVHRSTCNCGLHPATSPIATEFELQPVMSSNDTRFNYLFPKESGPNFVSEHLYEVDAANRRMTMAVNSGTESETPIRRNSSSQAASSARCSDRAPLVIKKAHWTIEERWRDEQQNMVNAEEPRDHDPAIVSPQGVREAPIPVRKTSGRKRRAGRMVGEQTSKTATGFNGKKDKYGLYHS